MEKRYLLLLVALACFTCSCSGAKTTGEKSPPGCDNLYFDLYTGTLNGMDPVASMDEIKTQFPCFTGDTEEGGGFNCGGGIFFLKHDFFFYTHRNYLDVRSKFKGKVSDDLLGKSRSEVEAKIGKPIMAQEDAFLYKTKYGTLSVTYSDDYAVRFEAFYTPPEQVKLCR